MSGAFDLNLSNGTTASLYDGKYHLTLRRTKLAQESATDADKRWLVYAVISAQGDSGLDIDGEEIGDSVRYKGVIVRVLGADAAGARFRIEPKK